MAGKSRPTSGKSPAAPVPLKADGPPSHKPAPRPSNAPAPQTVEPPVQSPNEAQVEAQVEALLDEAEQQVQAMSELVGDAPPPQSTPVDESPQNPAPPDPAAVDKPASAAAEAANVEESPASAPPLDDPVDPAALQSQVDAILAEAGHAAGVDDAEDLPSAAPEIEDDFPAAAAPSGNDAVDAAAPPMDIAAVDAVIADAAQRAMEQDEFETGAGDEAVAMAGAASPADSAERVDGESPRRVVKSGDASMRRVKPNSNRRSTGAADLDGGFAKSDGPRRDSAAQQEREALVETPTASEPPDSRWRARAVRAALRGMAAMNEPWSRWTPPTRYVVLAFTVLNITLAGVAYIIVLSRWF
ncbi:MAG: hypothetical protein IT430_18795 [Phycisphaerales bacterium]|nr:hypothetical protein [Phycisphaerales bacterium]